jgi:hypothetical protein
MAMLEPSTTGSPLQGIGIDSPHPLRSKDRLDRLEERVLALERPRMSWNLETPQRLETTVTEEANDPDQGMLGAPAEDRMSKTKATAMATTLAAAIYTVAALTGHPIPIPQEAAIGLLGGALALGQYFLRRAI